jgi:hypothetical protein
LPSIRVSCCRRVFACLLPPSRQVVLLPARWCYCLLVFFLNGCCLLVYCCRVGVTFICIYMFDVITNGSYSNILVWARSTSSN